MDAQLGKFDRLNAKMAWRLLPLLCVLMYLAYLDRITLSYAGPAGLSEDLGLTATMFGFAAGIFFLGYIALEVPSNILLSRFGARLWLARIIVTWGVVQTLTAFVTNPELLYFMRFMLGVAEAGFAPGVILYLTYWFPTEYRGRAVTRFLFAVMFASITGPLLATWLIDIGLSATPLGLTGWRFLIFATGVPAIAAGVAAWFLLVDGPERASWLSEAEKVEVERRLAITDEVTANATNAGAHVSRATVRAALRDRRVWLLGVAYFSFAYGAYSLTFFLPQIVGGFQEQFDVSYSPYQIAGLTAIPFLCGGLAQLWFGRRTDRVGQIGGHIAASAAVGLVAGFAANWATSPLVLMVCLCLMAIGVVAGAPLVLVQTASLFRGRGAATAIALVNSIGISAGFFGPYITGWLRDLTGQQNVGLMLIAVLLVTAIVVGLTTRSADPRVARAKEAAARLDAPAGQEGVVSGMTSTREDR